jgi:hypothetical protein
MVERSLSMRQVQGSMPCTSIKTTDQSSVRCFLSVSGWFEDWREKVRPFFLGGSASLFFLPLPGPVVNPTTASVRVVGGDGEKGVGGGAAAAATTPSFFSARSRFFAPPSLHSHPQSSLFSSTPDTPARNPPFSPAGRCGAPSTRTSTPRPNTHGVRPAGHAARGAGGSRRQRAALPRRRRRRRKGIARALAAAHRHPALSPGRGRG